MLPFKPDEPVLEIQTGNEEILDTLESLLHEIAEEESFSTTDQPIALQEVEEEDITSVLLDSLINGIFNFF